MGVERDEARDRQRVTGDPECRGNRERVVAAERDNELRALSELTYGGSRQQLSLLTVGVGEVARVDDPQRLVEHDFSFPAPAAYGAKHVWLAGCGEVARIPAQRFAHGSGSEVCIRRGERGLRRRYPDHREIDRTGTSGREILPPARTGPERVGRKRSRGDRVGHTCTVATVCAVRQTAPHGLVRYPGHSGGMAAPEGPRMR